MVIECPAWRITAHTEVLSKHILGDCKREERIEFENLNLFARLCVLDQLPKEDQETVACRVDAVHAGYEPEPLADRVWRSA